MIRVESLKASKLVSEVYTNRVSEKPCLVIVLHGDSPFTPPSYHYEFAKNIAEQVENVVAVGLLRSGFKDHLGRKSQGRKGFNVGDNYNRARIDTIAEDIQTFVDEYQPSKVIVAGHSGGAAITAKLIAYYPALAGYAFIVSCPTDINVWRKDMFKLKKYPLFLGKLSTKSPIDLVHEINEKTKVNVFCGADDPITQPYLSERYVESLILAKKKASLFLIEGEHDIFLNDEVTSSLINIIHSN